MKIKKQTIIVILIGIIASIFFCYPYLNNQVIEGHDLDFHLSRIQQLSIQMKNYNIPSMIDPDILDGFGYGTPLFYPNTFLYLPAMLILLGLTTITSYKILILLITFITYLIMYKTAKEISSSKYVGVVTALLYTFSLYRIEDVYTRCALGEVLAFTFIPLIVLGLYYIIYDNHKKWWVLAFGIFGVANSHIITFVLAIILVIIFVLINSRKLLKDKERLKSVLIAGIISVLMIISVFGIILEQELYADYKALHGGTAKDLGSSSLTISQILDNEFRDTDSTNMSLGNGYLILMLPLFIFITKWENKDKKRFIIQLAVFGLICLIMTSKIFPWQYFSIFNFIQLPWRLNIIITLCFSIVGGYVFYYTTNNKNAMYILSIIIVIMASSYLKNVEIINKPDEEKTYLEIGAGEYLPKDTFREIDFQLFDMDTREIYDYERKNGIMEIQLTNEKNSKHLSVPFLYYTGYRAYIIDENGEIDELEVNPNYNGMLLVSNPELKTGMVKVEYKITVIQIISYLITYSTLIVLIIYVIIDYIKKKK